MNLNETNINNEQTTSEPRVNLERTSSERRANPEKSRKMLTKKTDTEHMGARTKEVTKWRKNHYYSFGLNR